MIRVIAIDDEPLALRQIVNYINRVPQLTLVAECQSAVEAAGVLHREEIDAIFCDINMPDLNGMEFVRLLQRSDVPASTMPLVVFTTAYSEYALDGFQVAAVDYLLKPFGFNDFHRAADRIVQRHEEHTAMKTILSSEPKTERDNALPTRSRVGDTLYIRADHRTHAVAFHDVRYVQAMGEYLRIYVDSASRPLMTLFSMKRMEETLPPDRFMRIHRSYIISLDRIAQVARGRVILNDSTELPIGDNYRAAFEEWLSARMA